jgi:hypothetical protein
VPSSSSTRLIAGRSWPPSATANLVTLQSFSSQLWPLHINAIAILTQEDCSFASFLQPGLELRTRLSQR